MIVVLGYGNTIFNIVLNYFEIELPGFLHNLFILVKWGLGIIVIYILLKMLLTFAPDSPISSKHMTRGALFTTLGWVVATSAYSIYVTNFANYNIFYSSLANIVVLMFWIYILSYTLVIGITINSENYLYEKKIEEQAKKQEKEVE